MTDSTIRPAGDDRDIAWAADLVARSFDHLVPDRYVVPDDEERPSIMREFYRLLITYAADGGGEVLLSDGAVAVWFDRTNQAAPPADYEQRLTEITGPYLPRFQEIDDLLEKNQPADPHWHFAFLAVEADLRGQGRGGALMRHTHARLDEQGVATYLEATNPDNQRVYRRHGYTDMEPSAMRLPTGAVAFYRMWRPAG